MFAKLRQVKGFTLIEVMIVVAIIGILAAIAVLNFIAYRNKAKIAECIGTTESIRAAITGYAADSRNNEFPNAMPQWTDLISVCNVNGSTLKPTADMQGYSGFTYQGLDKTGAAVAANPADYYFIFRVAGVPADMTGAQIEVRPSGIERQTLGP